MPWRRRRQPTPRVPAGLDASILALLWRTSKRWGLAAVTALFPLLFLVDDWVRLPLSPVLPGLVVLALVLVALPFAVMEVQLRRAHRLAAREPGQRALRRAQASAIALGVAGIWFLAWLSLGA